MQYKKITTFLLLIITHLFFSQTTTFVSDKTGQPLPQVTVFGNDGSILAFSDIDGKIDRQKLSPAKENFQLVQDNFILGNFTFQDLNTDVVKLGDRTKDIESVTIKKGKPAKYILIKGNFNSYLTLNDKFNGYFDGVATYVFDNKTKKVKSVKIEEYRFFALEKAENDPKKIATGDYHGSLELPKLQFAGTIKDYKSNRLKLKELKGKNKDEVELTRELFQDKEFSLFGYRLYDVNAVMNLAYTKDSDKTLRDFLSSNEIYYMKMKHKSEPNYNQIIIYRNFYPTEIDFSDDKGTEGLKLDRNTSSYSSQFWKNPDFPDMQPIFSSFFKDDLKEKQNKK